MPAHVTNYHSPTHISGENNSVVFSKLSSIDPLHEAVRTGPTAAAAMPTATRPMPTAAVAMSAATRPMPTAAAAMSAAARAIPTAASAMSAAAAIPTAAAAIPSVTPADCLLNCLREVKLEKYYTHFLHHGITSCEQLADLAMPHYAAYGINSMEDQVRLFKLIQIIKTVQSDGLHCENSSKPSSNFQPNASKQSSYQLSHLGDTTSKRNPAIQDSTVNPLLQHYPMNPPVKNSVSNTVLRDPVWNPSGQSSQVNPVIHSSIGNDRLSEVVNHPVYVSRDAQVSSDSYLSNRSKTVEASNGQYFNPAQFSLVNEHSIGNFNGHSTSSVMEHISSNANGYSTGNVMEHISGNANKYSTGCDVEGKFDNFKYSEITTKPIINEEFKNCGRERESNSGIQIDKYKISLIGQSVSNNHQFDSKIHIQPIDVKAPLQAKSSNNNNYNKKVTRKKANLDDSGSPVFHCRKRLDFSDPDLYSDEESRPCSPVRTARQIFCEVICTTDNNTTNNNFSTINSPSRGIGNLIISSSSESAESARSASTVCFREDIAMKSGAVKKEFVDLGDDPRLPRHLVDDNILVDEMEACRVSRGRALPSQPSLPLTYAPMKPRGIRDRCGFDDDFLANSGRLLNKLLNEMQDKDHSNKENVMTDIPQDFDSQHCSKEVSKVSITHAVPNIVPLLQLSSSLGSCTTVSNTACIGSSKSGELIYETAYNYGTATTLSQSSAAPRGIDFNVGSAAMKEKAQGVCIGHSYSRGATVKCNEEINNPALNQNGISNAGVTLNHGGRLGSQASNTNQQLPSVTNGSSSLNTGEQRIRVCVRKRPRNQREIKRNEADIIKVRGGMEGGGQEVMGDVRRGGGAMVIVDEHKVAVDLTKYIQQHVLQFDEGFDETCDNIEVYRKTVHPLVTSLLNRGGAAVCFAFGQTGAGKTFTLLGSKSAPGLYELAARDIFTHTSSSSGASPVAQQLHVWMSYYEIYCGHIYDLLNKRKRLHLREDGRKKVCIAGLMENNIKDVNSLVEVVRYGNSYRSRGSTGVNPHSSRSHAVLQLELRDLRDQRTGRLTFIDLAGSERASDAMNADRQTRMEGAEINQSLLALKECIRSLDQHTSHTPYRQSKLTHILRDSFVGNCHTVMIANIAPTSSSAESTLNTLRYASRVQELRNHSTLRHSALLEEQQQQPFQVNSHLPHQPTSSALPLHCRGDPLHSRGAPSVFHPDNIQLSSTPVKRAPDHVTTTLQHGALLLDHILDESPVSGHRLHELGDSGRRYERRESDDLCGRISPIEAGSPASTNGFHEVFKADIDTGIRQGLNTEVDSKKVTDTQFQPSNAVIQTQDNQNKIWKNNEDLNRNNIENHVTSPGQVHGSISQKSNSSAGRDIVTSTQCGYNTTSSSGTNVLQSSSQVSLSKDNNGNNSHRNTAISEGLNVRAGQGGQEQLANHVDTLTRKLIGNSMASQPIYTNAHMSDNMQPENHWNQRRTSQDFSNRVNQEMVKRSELTRANNEVFHSVVGNPVSSSVLISDSSAVGTTAYVLYSEAKACMNSARENIRGYLGGGARTRASSAVSSDGPQSSGPHTGPEVGLEPARDLRSWAEILRDQNTVDEGFECGQSIENQRGIHSNTIKSADLRVNACTNAPINTLTTTAMRSNARTNVTKQSDIMGNMKLDGRVKEYEVRNGTLLDINDSVLDSEATFLPVLALDHLTHCTGTKTSESAQRERDSFKQMKIDGGNQIDKNFRREINQPIETRDFGNFVRDDVICIQADRGGHDTGKGGKGGEGAMESELVILQLKIKELRQKQEKLEREQRMPSEPQKCSSNEPYKSCSNEQHKSSSNEPYKSCSNEQHKSSANEPYKSCSNEPPSFGESKSSNSHGNSVEHDYRKLRNESALNSVTVTSIGVLVKNQKGWVEGQALHSQTSQIGIIDTKAQNHQKEFSSLNSIYTSEEYRGNYSAVAHRGNVEGHNNISGNTKVAAGSATIEYNSTPNSGRLQYEAGFRFEEKAYINGNSESGIETFLGSGSRLYGSSEEGNEVNSNNNRIIGTSEHENIESLQNGAQSGVNSDSSGRFSHQKQTVGEENRSHGSTHADDVTGVDDLGDISSSTDCLLAAATDVVRSLRVSGGVMGGGRQSEKGSHTSATIQGQLLEREPTVHGTQHINMKLQNHETFSSQAPTTSVSSILMFQLPPSSLSSTQAFIASSAVSRTCSSVLVASSALSVVTTLTVSASTSVYSAAAAAYPAAMLSAVSAARQGRVEESGSRPTPRLNGDVRVASRDTSQLEGKIGSSAVVSRGTGSMTGKGTSSMMQRKTESNTETRSAKSASLMIGCHEDQLSAVTVLCKQEMGLLLAVKSGQLGFEDYLFRVQEILSTKAKIVEALTTHITEFNENST